MVGADDLGGDAESEAEVAFFAAGSVAAVEAFKNLFFFGIRDTGTVIFHRKTDVFPMTGKDQAHRSLFRRVAEGIVQQDGEYLTESAIFFSAATG